LSSFITHSWPAYEKGGLSFRIIALDPAPYYFAGDTPRFKLLVENRGEERRALGVNYMAWANRTPVPETYSGAFEIPPTALGPGESGEFTARVSSLVPGGLVLQITFLKPEDPHDSRIVPLGYYTVFDRGAKEESDRHLSKIETLQTLTLLAFVASVATQAIVLYVTLGR
jgi:hypothetical protein